MDLDPVPLAQYFSENRRSMRTITYRKRTVDDDIKSTQRLPNARVDDDTITIPERPGAPIVVWKKPSSAKDDDPDVLRSSLNWPLSSDKRCHNCAHFYEGVPVPLPVSRDELRQVYFCEGKFCSWQCAKSFNMRETSPAGKGNRNMYIAVLAYKTWIKLKHPVDIETREKMKTYCNYRLVPAKPRSTLAEFGGDLSIEEYRKDFCGIVPPSDLIENTSPLLTIRRMAVLPFIDTDSAAYSAVTGRSSRRPSLQRMEQTGFFLGTRRIETNRVQEFNNSFVDRLKKARLDPAIMRRKKAVDVSNTLLSSMGIEVKKRPSR
ncbi:unnamed protein product [Ectocarpus sp. 12 AP-2014]